MIQDFGEDEPGVAAGGADGLTSGGKRGGAEAGGRAVVAELRRGDRIGNGAAHAETQINGVGQSQRCTAERVPTHSVETREAGECGPRSAEAQPSLGKVHGKAAGAGRGGTGRRTIEERHTHLGGPGEHAGKWGVGGDVGAHHQTGAGERVEDCEIRDANLNVEVPGSFFPGELKPVGAATRGVDDADIADATGEIEGAGAHALQNAGRRANGLAKQFQGLERNGCARGECVRGACRILNSIEGHRVDHPGGERCRCEDHHRGIRAQARRNHRNVRRELKIGGRRGARRTQGFVENYLHRSEPLAPGTQHLGRGHIGRDVQDRIRGDVRAQRVPNGGAEARSLVIQGHRKERQRLGRGPGDRGSVSRPLDQGQVFVFQLDGEGGGLPFHGDGVGRLRTNDRGCNRSAVRKQEGRRNRPLVHTVRPQPAHREIVAAASLLLQR